MSCYLISTGINYCGSVITVIGLIQNPREAQVYTLLFYRVHWLTMKLFSFWPSSCERMKQDMQAGGWQVPAWTASHDRKSVTVSGRWSDNVLWIHHVQFVLPYGSVISITYKIRHSYHVAPYGRYIYATKVQDWMINLRSLWRNMMLCKKTSV